MAALHLPPFSISPSLPSSSSRSPPLCGLLLPTPSRPSSASRVQNVHRQRSLILRSASFNGFRTTPPCSIFGRRGVIAHASSEIDGTDAGSSDAPKDGAEDSVSVESLPLETKLQLKLEQKLRMKLAKKIRLRRKRLVRKRRMRKKGRWPPSKMKKNKNI